MAIDALNPETIGPISMTDIVRYSGASGDLNPLHHDSQYARSAGYDDVVVMGSLFGGWAASKMTAGWREGPLKVSVVYKSPVLRNDELELIPDGNSASVLRRSDKARVMSVMTENEATLTPLPSTSLEASFELVVEVGAARLFRKAIQADNGHNSLEVPPTFLVTATHWRPNGQSAVAELGFDLKRMLHARSTFRFAYGPLMPGQRLTVLEHFGPRSQRMSRSGEMLQVATIHWTFLSENLDPYAEMEYEMVELPEKAIN